MRNFEDTFETRKRSFICAFLICMTVPFFKCLVVKSVKCTLISFNITLLSTAYRNE